MTPLPACIHEGGTVADAHRIMHTHLVRHLPVLRRGRLVGIVSDRDLHRVETLGGGDPASVPVQDAMTEPVFTVDPNASLAKTAREMAAHRYGSAVVLDHGIVVGLFTTTDALRALAAVLESPSQEAA